MSKTKLLKTACACAAAAMTLCMASCDKTPDLTGVWEGAPSQLMQSGTRDVSGTLASSQIASRIIFTPSQDNKRMGSVSITSDITLMDAVPADSMVVSTYEVSVSATSSIAGTYHFEDGDDDDVLIALDNSTLQVNVDPEAVTYNVNVLDGVQSPELEKMRPALAQRYQQHLKTALQLEYAKYQKLNDVKVKNGILSCEINDRDFSFRLVP